MTNWFKIWTEESKKDTDEGQLYLRLVNQDANGLILLAITKADGETFNNNVVMELNAALRSCIFHIIDDGLPLKNDIHNIPLYSDTIKERTIENGYKGVHLEMTPMTNPILQKMMEEARNLSGKQMEQADKETKH